MTEDTEDSLGSTQTLEPAEDATESGPTDDRTLETNSAGNSSEIISQASETSEEVALSSLSGSDLTAAVETSSPDALTPPATPPRQTVPASPSPAANLADDDDLDEFIIPSLNDIGFSSATLAALSAAASGGTASTSWECARSNPSLSLAGSGLLDSPPVSAIPNRLLLGKTGDDPRAMTETPDFDIESYGIKSVARKPAVARTAIESTGNAEPEADEEPPGTPLTMLMKRNPLNAKIVAPAATTPAVSKPSDDVFADS